jgi:hypothetical protein
MPKKRYDAEEIIHKLPEADVLLSQGMNIGQVRTFIVFCWQLRKWSIRSRNLH